MEKLTHCIGPSLSFTYKEWYGLHEAQARQATAFYRERFEREGILENTLYEGIPELLEKLKARGKTLAIATAKPTVHAVRILEYQGIASYFSAVFGSNLDGTRENKSEVIAFALAEMKPLQMKAALMVGDRSHDILGARENGLASIAVGYGYGTTEELTEARPDGHVRSVEELSRYLLGDW